MSKKELHTISLDKNYWEGQGIQEIQCLHWYKEGHWIVCINPEEAIVGWMLKIFWDDGSEGIYRVTAVKDLWIVDIEGVND